MTRTRALLALAAAVPTAVTLAAPSSAACYGSTGTVYACHDWRRAVDECVYTGGPSCTPVVVNTPCGPNVWILGRHVVFSDC